MASGELGHYALGLHAAGQHVPVVTVSCYDLIALFQGHLHANDDRFLADIEMAKAADRAHAIELTGFFLKTPDQQHVAKRAQFLLAGEFQSMVGAVACLFRDGFLWCSHGKSG